MPTYLETDDRDLAKKLIHSMVCAVCGSGLATRYDIKKHLPFLVCTNDNDHEGIGKPNKQEDNSFEGGLRQMQVIEQQHGLDKTRQLAKYQGVTSLSRPQAMEIMDTIWPDAPAPDKIAAAILCASYGLNPLAGHVFLIPFKEKDTGKLSWTRVWGIKAKRLVASRRGGYSYLDFSPRLMTEEEQIKVWGAVDKVNLCYMTLLQDTKTGAQAYGFGKWPKDRQPKGTDKGNSQANMASIRSESQALDRLRPAEMPSGFEVADEQYIEGEGKVIDTATGEIIEGETEKIIDAVYPTPDGANAQQVAVPPKPTQPPGDQEVADIIQLAKDVHWDRTVTLNSWLIATLKIPSGELSGLKLNEVIEHLNHEQREKLCQKLKELAEVK